MNFSLCITHITDPRDSKNQKYSLKSLLFTLFSGVISGFDSPSDLTEFAQEKLKWLNQFVELPAAPCPETFRYLIVAIKPTELMRGFESFIQEIHPEKRDSIAIDGKTMRGTANKNQSGLHVLSAWSSLHGITLAALESSGKQNEIETIPKLLDKLDLSNATVTIDAMGCQKKIARKIIENGGDYLLQVKNNQGVLLQELQAYYHKLKREDFFGVGYEEYRENDKAHGRIESRHYTQFMLNDWISVKDDWHRLTTGILVERWRQMNGVETTEHSWFISSLPLTAQHVAHSIRGHWEIENKLHWRLDVTYREDACALHSGHAAMNMAILKRLCLNLFNKDTKKRRSTKVKIKLAEPVNKSV